MQKHGPSFVVIGAQRSGTTWLHRVLRQHQDLWLTPVKELHYFDKPKIRFGCLDSAERRRACFWELKRMRRDPLWYARYWLLPRDDDWYAELFSSAARRGKITGEITPAYATLGENKWQHIASLYPQLKLVFVMRDPIIRTWSALRNRMRKGFLDPGASIETLLTLAREESVSLRSDYLRTINLVEALFGLNQLHCCFFEQLSTQPKDMADSLFSFLGVEPLGERLQAPPAINVASGGNPPPPDLQRELARDYLPMVDSLAERLGPIPLAWANRYRSLIS
jgi:hypothetical protein